MSAPHTCPVCEGRGQVPFGFYNQLGPYSGTSITITSGTYPETCRSCQGQGVVWPPSAPQPLFPQQPLQPPIYQPYPGTPEPAQVAPLEVEAPAEPEEKSEPLERPKAPWASFSCSCAEEVMYGGRAPVGTCTVHGLSGTYDASDAEYAFHTDGDTA